MALREEFEALPEDRRAERNQTHGGYDYFWQDPQSGYRCVATFADRMGQAEAALLTERLLAFRPVVLVNVGIAGSLHDDVRIGDVVVPELVCAYDKPAKAVDAGGADGAGQGWRWIRRGDAFRCDHGLIQEVQHFPTAHLGSHAAWCTAGAERFGRLRAANPIIAVPTNEAIWRDQPKVITDACLASGNFVGASTAFATWIREQNADIKAIEMEAAGMLLSAAKRVEQIPSLVIRGISDHVRFPKEASDRIQGGALRRLAMANAWQLLLALMKLEVFPRAGEGRAPGQPAAREPEPSTSTSSFQYLSALPLGEASYIERPTDEALRGYLNATNPERSCTFIGGQYGTGKSSLLLRASQMASSHGTDCFVDLTAFTSRKVDNLMRAIASALGVDASPGDLEPIQRAIDAQGLLLRIDEFGAIDPDERVKVAESILYLSRSCSRCRVVVCSPVALDQLFPPAPSHRGGNPMFHAMWNVVTLRAFERAEVSKLLERLPVSHQTIAQAQIDGLLRGSHGIPRLVQRACRQIELASPAQVPSVIGDPRTYDLSGVP